MILISLAMVGGVVGWMVDGVSGCLWGSVGVAGVALVLCLVYDAGSASRG